MSNPVLDLNQPTTEPLTTTAPLFNWDAVLKTNNNKFPETYAAAVKSHFNDIQNAAVSNKFSDIETVLKSFWGGLDVDKRKELASDEICNSIAKADTQYYETLLKQLIPDVFVLMDPSTPKQIRSFAKHCDSWLRKALDGFPEVFVLTKLKASIAFGQKLRRYTGLNHLVQAVREVLKNPIHVEKMQQDYEKVDFPVVQEQLMRMCTGCSRDTITRHEEKFRDFQQSNCTITSWASWLQGIVAECMGKFDNETAFTERGSQLLRRWSLISSLIIRDLTLRSAASFGPFHLMRLLCDEYMYFLVESATRAKGCHPIKHESLGNDVPAIIIRAPTVETTDAITAWLHLTFEPVKASAAQVDAKRLYLAHCKATKIETVTESQLSKMLHAAFPGCYGDAGHFQGIRARPTQPLAVSSQISAPGTIKSEYTTNAVYRPQTIIHTTTASAKMHYPINNNIHTNNIHTSVPSSMVPTIAVSSMSSIKRPITAVIPAPLLDDAAKRPRNS